MNIPEVSELARLEGRALAEIGHAADMLTLGFKRHSSDASGGGLWFIHIQCPWRLEKEDRIITGSFDWWEHESESVPPEAWEPLQGGSLQMLRLREMLGDRGPNVRGPLLARDENLVVVNVSLSAAGDLTVMLADGIRLLAFPAGCRGEYWRVFEKDSTEPHLVCEGEPDFPSSEGLQ